MEIRYDENGLELPLPENMKSRLWKDATFHRNEITTPLEYVLKAEPELRKTGIIKVVDMNTKERHPIGKLIWEQFWNGEFQYIFEFDWDKIDVLPDGIMDKSYFPGLDFEYRLHRYYRVNVTPAFLIQRTPSRDRQDVAELMRSVGLEYYDRFEFLLRTNLMSCNDNYVVDAE